MNRPKEIIILQYADSLVPLTITYNSRKNVRFKFSSKGGAISMPPFLKNSDKEKFIDKGKSWTKDYLAKHPEWLTVFSKNKYQEGQIIKTNLKSYTIVRKEYTGKTQVKLNGNLLELTIPESPIDQFKILYKIRTAIHKRISKDQLVFIERLVDETNDRTLQVDINNIKLKYNQSNWGSCSSNRNLSFSSRLLFAPEWVFISVVKHELAHFKEMNHSNAFWNIVKAIDKDYLRSDKWLKANSWNCDF